MRDNEGGGLFCDSVNEKGRIPPSVVNEFLSLGEYREDRQDEFIEKKLVPQFLSSGQ